MSETYTFTIVPAYIVTEDATNTGTAIISVVKNEWGHTWSNGVYTFPIKPDRIIPSSVKITDGGLEFEQRSSDPTESRVHTYRIKTLHPAYLHN